LLQRERQVSISEKRKRERFRSLDLLDAIAMQAAVCMRSRMLHVIHIMLLRT
jgi:hypothetical protein